MRRGLIVLAALALLGLWAVLGAVVTAHAAVPERCRAYQRQITAQAHTVFGPAAPVATLAADIEQESACNPRAQSPYAKGLAQFTDSTAADMARRYPTELGPADPFNPSWSIAAQALYLRDLTRQNAGRTECDTWAFGLAAYNGGAGWLIRDRAAARAQGVPSDVWFGAVELTPDRRRAQWAITENRGYPRRILLTMTPIYVAGGYGRGIACSSRP